MLEPAWGCWWLACAAGWNSKKLKIKNLERCNTVFKCSGAQRCRFISIKNCLRDFKKVLDKIDIFLGHECILSLSISTGRPFATDLIALLQRFIKLRSQLNIILRKKFFFSRRKSGLTYTILAEFDISKGACDIELKYVTMVDKKKWVLI